MIIESVSFKMFMSYEKKLLKKRKYLKRACVNFNLTNILKNHHDDR